MPIGEPVCPLEMPFSWSFSLKGSNRAAKILEGSFQNLRSNFEAKFWNKQTMLQRSRIEL